MLAMMLMCLPSMAGARQRLQTIRIAAPAISPEPIRVRVPVSYTHLTLPTNREV